MASEPPTIVIVQGSFQTPLVYDLLQKGLRDAGFPVVHPRLPSCSGVDNEDFPARTLTDDALTVTKAIEQLVEQGKRVVVVMHSYGGLVGSEAIPKSLAYAVRQAQGQRGGVIRLFYFTALILGIGQSVHGTFGVPPDINVMPDGRFTLKEGAKFLYNDLLEQEAKLWESRLIPQSYRVHFTAITRAAYEYIPSTYLICENDLLVRTQSQEMNAGAIKAHVERCSAGHSPMLSQPEMLVQKIAAAAERGATI